MDRESNAHKHHVTKALVGRIVRAAKKDPESLRARQEKEDMQQALVDNIKTLYENWDEHAHGMMTTGRIKKLVKERYGLDVSASKIWLVLKRRLGLSYLKIKNLQLQTNSVKALGSRQEYA